MLVAGYEVQVRGGSPALGRQVAAATRACPDVGPIVLNDRGSVILLRRKNLLARDCAAEGAATAVS